MPNARKPPKPQATNAASKENPPSQTKITKPVVKAVGKSHPLEMSRSRTTSHGAKDADTLVLLERIALLQAENDKLNKRQAAKPIEKKTKEIPRPAKITKLQHDMGLADDRRLYSHCRATVRDVIACADLLPHDWCYQDLAAVAKVAEVAKSKNDQLQLYQGNWAAFEIMKTLLKNKRSYRRRLGSANQADEDIVMSDGEELESNNNKEGSDGGGGGDGGEGGDSGEGGDGDEEGDDDKEGDGDKGGNGEEGENGEEGGNSDEEENHQDNMHDDIYEDYNSTTKIPAMEMDGNGGGGEGTSGKQGNDDVEGNGGDQVSAIKPVVSKKPAASIKAKPTAAKKPAVVKKPAAMSKATK